MRPFCMVCRKPIQGEAYQRVMGWQRMAGRRASGSHGGSDISARRTVDLYACGLCVDREKNGTVGQGVLV